MMKELKIIKRRHVLNIIHFVLALHLFIYAGLALIVIVCAVYDKVNHGAAEINIVGAACLVIAAVLAAAFIGFRAYLKRVDREMDEISPFVFSLPFSTENDVLDALNSRLKLRVLDDNSLYGWDKGKRIIQLFLIETEGFSAEDVQSLKDKCIALAQEKQLINSTASRDDLVSSAFVYLFLVNRLTENAAEFLKRPTDLNTIGLEMNVILDLEKMQLHIPGCVGRDLSPSDLYVYCMEKFMEWFAVEK